MLVLDPIVVVVKNLPPWVIALASVLATAALLTQRKRAANAKTSTKPRKIHSLGTTLPIIGDMCELTKNADIRQDWITAQCMRFDNEPWQVKIPGTPTLIMLSDPATIAAVLVQQSENFVKGAVPRELLHEILGDGIVNSDGEQWYHQRKTAAKFFSARTLRVCMMQTMQRNMQQVYKELDRFCGTSNLANLTSLMHQFSLQTFLQVGVGSLDTQIIGKTEPSALKALDEAFLLIVRRRYVPPFVWKLQRWLNVGPEKKLKELTDETYAYIKNLIDQTLSQETNSETSDHDQEEKVRSAIDLFVEHSGDDKAGLRPSDLVDFVLNFVFAARDTSSMTMLYFFYRLSKHPEIEAKIREELASKVQPLGVGRDGYITADQVKTFVYLEAVIKETLRLHPAGPLLMRQALEDTVLDNDVYVRKGQEMGISIYAMARNPRVWGPDAAEFKPERWIDATTGELIVVPQTKFLTFSAGSRTCIGMKLAMLNLRVLTANLLYRYKFEIDAENDGSHLNSFLLVMKHAVLAKVERI